MKKYYFLNKYKKWQGPYLYAQILFFCLKGDIKPTTFLWHNKLATDIGTHPSLSIYARKKAYEFRSLPAWIFGHNLKIIALNTINKCRKIFNKKSNWEKIVSKPIETPKILENATKVYLTPSITAIHDFIVSGDFRVKLIYIDRDAEKTVKTAEYPIKLTSDHNPGIKFEITMAQPPSVGGVEHKESYGLHRSLVLVGENENIAIGRNSTFDFTTKFPYSPQILKGRFKQANLITDNNYKNEYNRLIIKVEDDKFIRPQDIISSTGTHLYDHDKFNVHSSLMGVSFKTGGSYIEVKIGDAKYSFYSVEGDLIIVDGLNKENLDIFKLKAEIIRIALAIMSGKFYGGSCNYVTSADENFKHIDGIWYELEKESVTSNRRTIDLITFISTFNTENEDYEKEIKSIDKGISPKIFSALCNALWENENLLHAANLIVSGMGNTDPLQQGALYSVGLETLTSTLGEAKSDELKPIQEKAISKQFVADLKDVLSKYQDSISEESVTIIGKKIDAINTPTNRDKLVKTFEIYGVILSEDDKKIIDKRNDYLHGRNPLTFKETFELTQISLRLHTLLVALLMKSIGYNGHIINLDIKNYLSDEEKLLEVLSEEQKQQTELINQLSQAIEEQDKSKFQIIKTQLTEHLGNSKLSSLIRII